MASYPVLLAAVALVQLTCLALVAAGARRRAVVGAPAIERQYSRRAALIERRGGCPASGHRHSAGLDVCHETVAGPTTT